LRYVEYVRLAEDAIPNSKVTYIRTEQRHNTSNIIGNNAWKPTISEQPFIADLLVVWIYWKMSENSRHKVVRESSSVLPAASTLTTSSLLLGVAPGEWSFTKDLATSEPKLADWLEPLDASSAHLPQLTFACP
jgi:hypothetical protein